MIEWRPIAELEAEARVIVEAVIVADKPPRKNFAFWEYEYRIEVETVRRGRLKKKKVDVTFADLKAHFRGDMVVCPIKHGSNIEHELKVGKRYELFLRSAEDPEILLARPLDAEPKDDDEANAGPRAPSRRLRQSL